VYEPRRSWVLAICCVSILIVVMDISIVNVALPAMRAGLGASVDGLQWTVDAYTLVLAGFLVLAGSLAGQSRRCGRPGCRCADGEPHGPYAYFTPRPGGRGRARYVPAALEDAVRRYLRRGTEVEAALAEISAINAELLARRELE